MFQSIAKSKKIRRVDLISDTLWQSEERGLTRTEFLVNTVRLYYTELYSEPS